MSNNYVKLSIILSLVLMVISCGFSSSEEFTYRDNDQEQLELLVNLLENKNIPFVYNDGVIRYKRDVKNEVEMALNELATAASIQYVDSDLREHFQSLLYVEGIKFMELDRDGGSWTLWWVDSKEREMEILGQVTEYQINRQMEEDLDCESGSADEQVQPSFIEDALKNSSSS